MDKMRKVLKNIEQKIKEKYKHKFDLGILNLKTYVEFRTELINIANYNEDFDINYNDKRIEILYNDRLEKSIKFHNLIQKYYRPFKLSLLENEKGVDYLFRFDNENDRIE